MRTEAIELLGISERNLAMWRELAARAIEPNPFYEPEYVLPLARGLGQEAEVRLIVAGAGDGWSACLPVHAASRWHHVPLHSVASWRGHRLYGLLGTPLVAGDDPGASLSHLLDAAFASRSGSAFLALDWLGDGGPAAAGLAEAFAGRTADPITFDRFERAVVHRRPQPTYVEETLSSKHRRELRRQRRKLSEALGSEPEMIDRAGDDAAYDAFLNLEAASAKSASGTMLAEDPGHAEFFREMCAGFAALGRLHLFELRCGERTVAAKCNLTAGDTVFFFKIAYDPDWSGYSPGIMLEMEMLKFFHDETEAEFMDSCADTNNAMINRLWPDRRSIVSHALPAEGLRGRVAQPVLTAARSIRNRFAIGE